METKEITTAQVIEMYNNLPECHDGDMADVLAHGEVTEIATLSQDTQQYDNLYLMAFAIGHNVVVYENNLDGGKFYLVEGSSFEPDDYKALLEEMAQCWASNATDSNLEYQLEMCRWGLRTPEDYAAAPDHAGDVCIVEVENYYGYSPIDVLREENSWDVRWFASYAEAEEWIDDQENNTYYLSHNEAGRPEYTIWEG